MNPSPTPTKPRGIGKKIALVCAGCSFTCGFLALGLALWFWVSHGATHVYTASLLATTFFFVSAAVVLYEMSKPQPLLPPDETA
jgi:multisubunit Na+/H+ antiporter MnhG subunit